MAPGSTVPPLNLDDDEALAVAVALRETALRGVLGSDQAALSALFKLQRILPRRVADRLSAFADSVVHTAQGPGDPVSSEVLLQLADACRHRHRLHLVYCDSAGRRTGRAADPYRLVGTRNRWYLVALDVERGQWRTFRADRVFVAGEDLDAKKTVTTLLREFGWPDEAIMDLGGIRAARGAEMYGPLLFTVSAALGTYDFNLAIVRK
jgi:predicted DNA-binding transcriptional regulator YafY